MSQPPYRALQVALRIFSVLFAVGGLFMILATEDSSSGYFYTLRRPKFRPCCCSS